ncbi:MAG: hypothetical protein GWN99_15245, partial [Gemmatimonadetes bacterium]|nr:hypothetical protein [Gemmatimonadota bacterium]NIS02402.1 hypothetical protein [Gemmatimonadota bacterium]NIT68306.1 hypothetical protein [Gemmatimonadota bacterium]NIU54773.1 hypothetical protein [Gemmatimonadota bacterium]NIV24878.1 hypothetical protein [Gemmatimonadota bacterium]
NLLASDRFKDRDRNSLLESPESRGELLDDLYGQLDRDRLESSYLYRLIHEERP